MKRLTMWLLARCLKAGTITLDEIIETFAPGFHLHKNPLKKKMEGK